MFCSLFLLLRLKIFYIIFLFYHSHQNIGDLLKFHLILDLGQIFLAVFLQHFQNNDLVVCLYDFFRLKIGRASCRERV